MRYWMILIFGMSSCSRPVANEEGSFLIKEDIDSLAAFPMGHEMVFVGTNSNDQIALLFKRTDGNEFQYKIELSRKWKGLPFGSGVVHFQGIDKDSVFSFSGRSAGCRVLISIFQSSEPFNGRFAKIQRECKDLTQNIKLDEFPLIWKKQ